jgi:hypothetical protein
MKRNIVFFLVTSLILVTGGLCTGEVQVLERNDLTVLFEPSLRQASKEVADIYPAIKGEIEATFGWNLGVKPALLLISDGRSFSSMAENPLTVAFAVPSRGLIVINYSKMRSHPFNFEDTLRHEICHLMLHEHIKGPVLPRWLDEGVCQWASGGAVDIIMDQKRSLLNRAVLRGRFIPLSSLQRGFPITKDPLLLAYEESKGFVEYIVGRYGKEGILKVLEHLKRGEEVETAVLRSLSIALDRLEEEWHGSLKKKMTWFIYLSYHIYEILFTVLALLVIVAFIRAMVKKRAYRKGEAE